MRSVRIVVKQVTGSVPALVAASVLGASGCGSATSTPPHASSGGTSSSSAGSGGIIVLAGSPAVGGSAGSGPELPPGCQGYEVQLPEVGQPAVAGEICAVQVEPVISNGAARIALAQPGSDLSAPVAGTLTLAEGLRDQVQGPPVIEIVSATDQMLLEAELSALEQTADGYAFTVTWPKGAFLRAEDMTRVSFRTSLDLSCDTGTRLVNAVTEVHLCGGSFNGVPDVWASTGDLCVVCNVIAELAASPIIPDHRESGLPLGQAMRARIVELAKVGSSVVLFAENDGGGRSSYEWHVTGGTLEHIAEDVVVFRSDGSTPAPSLQVAIVNDEGVAVVSYAYPGGAH
jgi:hypothetical protein